MISKLSFVFSKVFWKITLFPPKMLILKRGVRRRGKQADTEKKKHWYREKGTGIQRKRIGFRLRRTQIRIALSF